MVEFFQYIGQEWQVIGGAPFTFFVALILAGAVIWAVVKGMNAATESALRERISLRDDQLLDYKEKLAGASPDEAKELIATLEKRIAELEPPALSASQQQSMIEILSRAPGRVTLYREMGSSHLSKLQAQLSSVLKQAGWTATNHTGLDMNFEPEESVTLTSPNRTDPQFLALVEALKVGNITFKSDVDETYIIPDTGEPTLSIRFAADFVKMDGFSIG
jgi:hypothetical protein